MNYLGGILSKEYDLGRILAPKNFLPLIPVLVVTSTLSNADPESLASIGVWLLANLLALVFVGVSIGSISSWLARDPSRGQQRLAALVGVGIVIALSKSAITFAIGLLLEGQFNLALWAQGLLGGVFLGPVILLLIALYLGGKDAYSAERELLLAERVRKLAGEPKSTENTFSLYRDLVDQSRIAIAKLRVDIERGAQGQGLAERAKEIRTIAEFTIRPLSHRIWSEQAKSLPNFSIRELSQISLLNGTTAPVPFTLIIAPGIWVWLIEKVNILEASFAMVLILVLNLTLQWLSGKTGRLSRAGAISRFVLLQSCLVGFTTLIMVSTAQQTAADVVAVIVALAVWFPTFSWLLGIYIAGNRTRAELQEELAQFIDGVAAERQLANSIQRAESRALAQALHSQIQNELLSTALKMEQGVLVSGEEIATQLAEVEQSLERLGETGVQTPGALAEVISSSIDAWEGFLKIELALEGDLNPWNNRSVEIEQVLNEALSNAHRHGRASVAQVRFQGDEILELTVIDNGVGIGQAKPGLGFQLFEEIGRGDYSITNLESGTSLSLRIARAG